MPTPAPRSEHDVETDRPQLFHLDRRVRRRAAPGPREPPRRRRTGIEDAGFLRDRPTPIDLFDDKGEKLICRMPWEHLVIHANGDVFPCMAWTRPPIGNFARQTFTEIWNGEELEAIRCEFAAVRPGLDCLNCVIRREAADPEGDFFYRKVAKPLESGAGGRTRPEASARSG
jgi:radical SAM protein with 4Fe4S-binding SPASM domain